MANRSRWIRRSLAAVAAAAMVFGLTLMGVSLAASNSDEGRQATPADAPRSHSSVPADFVPAAIAANQDLGRYFVTMSGDSVVSAMRGGATSDSAQEATANAARASQEPAIAETQSAGGKVIFRYDTLVNGFSAAMSPQAASDLAERSDVDAVEPVSIVQKMNESSVPFIGATKVWKKLKAQGQGVVVADVDTGVDYTHKNFGGRGTRNAYNRNNPNIIEPGSFPTKKVIGGFDFVGPDYSVTDDDTTNDIPHPDPDPLDDGIKGDHGSHTAGTCCGKGVKGEIGPGVAPRSKLLAIKVWDSGDSTADVLVAGFELAVDPNGDGSTKDAADVLTFSGGVDYGSANSVEALAAQRVVDVGTVLVAAAGNSGNQVVGASAYIHGTPASAPGVISVAASIDDFEAQTIAVNSPDIDLPDQGLMVEQDFGGALPDGGITADLFDGRELDPPPSPGNENPADAQFCDPLPPGSLAGKTVMVFKGSSGEGDCAGSTKSFNAQQAGAQAVILVSLFGGAPSALSSNGEAITIPVVMITANDAYAILDELSPGSPPAYNSGTVNATLNNELTSIDSYTDAMTDFTSEGPARVTNALKPDISAPGYDIQSTDAGTGDKGVKFSGTSMATPHVAGVAALLVQLHPKWSPEQIKAAMMNHANQDLKDNLLGSPVSATVMGAGRVDAFGAAKTVSLATPGSLSYGLKFAADTVSDSRSFTLTNKGRLPHTYRVSGGGPRYSDFAAGPAGAQVAVKGGSFGKKVKVRLDPKESKRIKVQMTLDPSGIDPAEQEFGLYYFHPNIDGNIEISQDGAAALACKVKPDGKKGGKKHRKGGKNCKKIKENGDLLHVPWHVAPLAASKDRLSKSSLDLTGAGDSLAVNAKGVGVSAADLYQLGATDPVNSRGEEDITGIGARSFTGGSVSDDTPAGIPPGTDALGGIGYLDFFADPDAPTEPIEFGVHAAGVHNTTETLEVDVLVDAGADGVYAGDDEGIAADYLLVKQAASGGETCVFDLSLPDALDDCAALYYADYSNYNSNLVGLVADAGDIGITNADPEIAYQVVSCTGQFSGDVPSTLCDTAGDIGAGDVYEPRLNATDPAIELSEQACGGFWGGSACDTADPVEVSAGSAGPGDDPGILALFPNNAPKLTPTVVETNTGP